MLRSPRAVPGLLTALLLSVLWVVAARPAAAQLCGEPPLPACEETTTTTEAETTTTTEETTTTTEAETTTTTTAPTRTTSTSPATTASTAPTTTATTAPPVLLAEGPPPVTGPDGSTSTTTLVTEPVADEDTDDGRTARQVTLVVTSLLVLAVVFGLLTYWYWRRTAPSPSRSVASSS